jgi:hypothetical protein
MDSRRIASVVTSSSNCHPAKAVCPRFSPFAVHSSRQGLARGLPSLGDPSLSNVGFEIFQSAEQSPESRRGEPGRLCSTEVGRAASPGNSRPRGHLVAGEDGHAGSEQEISEPATEHAAEPASERRGSWIDRPGGTSTEVNGIAHRSKTCHHRRRRKAIHERWQQHRRTQPTSLRRHCPRREPIIAVATAGSRVHTQESSTWQATFRASRRPPRESSAHKTPMEREATRGRLPEPERAPTTAFSVETIGWGGIVGS